MNDKDKLKELKDASDAYFAADYRISDYKAYDAAFDAYVAAFDACVED